MEMKSFIVGFLAHQRREIDNRYVGKAVMKYKEFSLDTSMKKNLFELV